MNDLFDRALPSPIQAILRMRSSGQESVVVAGSGVSEALHVDTGLERRLLDVLTAPGSPVRLVVLSGSAGGGKSSAIDRLLSACADLFESYIEDATHAETPRADQVERLEAFFQPFRDGASAGPGKPRLIAMNTGLMLRFFRDLGRRTAPSTHGLGSLETILRKRMGLRLAATASLSPQLEESVLVVNLDHRPTTGGDASLFSQLLQAVAPSSPVSPFRLAGRCGTCTVRDWCVPRTNAELLGNGSVTRAVDELADRIARERGRPLPPRALRDLVAAFVVGGPGFDAAADPCDVVAAWRDRADSRSAFNHLVGNGPLVDPEGPGLAGTLARSDPSYAPSAKTHDIISSTGIDANADIGRLVASLGGPDRPAVLAAAQALPYVALEVPEGRSALARCLVRVAYLTGEIALPDEPDPLFATALDEYANGTAGDGAIAKLEDLIGSALARSFGYELGLQRYFRAHASKSGSIEVLVAADLGGTGPATLRVQPDPVQDANPVGARIAGYRPHAITVQLAGVHLQVDTPLFRVLDRAASGARPSADELERFYSLRRAVEALGREASRDHEQPLLLADTTSGVKHRLTHRRDFRGQPQISVQEVH